ncbi:MAG: Asp-tRNA(Asn)/Glu-tRNA(Gln) amidotransferase GatCAB subunit A, partial [Candidatus Marinimicrobia bacterium]|nr:Asp-tRNA(Asn)/Glu-tRNA(Gln) amidotransferase GatCAB subunit A [Candidatus Neomarinimicrobiota bacterium]
MDLKKKIEEFQENFSKYNNIYNCFISDTTNLAFDRISKFSKLDKNKKLFGKLVAIKDNLNYINTKTTCGSKILDNYESIYNATVVDRVLDNGGLIVGKTNMDEFAMGSSSEFSYYGVVKNSLDTNYVSGGSSGGSAVAVSSGLVDMALGSDTGGSVRQPASFCDIYGLKPTYGRLSRYGLVAFASSFDQVGIFANNTSDTALLFNSIAGYDENDSTSSKEKNYKFVYEQKKVKKLTIGIPKEYINKGIDIEILKSFEKLKIFLKKNGFKTKEISLPHTEFSVPTYYILSTAEASSNLARFDGIRYGFSKRNNDLNESYKSTRNIGFGDEVKRRIILGTFVLSSGYYDAYYNKAQKIRTL